ncbi:MAG: hypothetical protein V1780_02345, partial [Chloroflexota bacterium]
MGSKRHFSQGGRHVSDKQRRDSYLLRRDTKDKYDVAVMDRPIALIDIGEKRISKIIRSVVGDFDDTFQDAWVKVLESQPQTEDEVLDIARQVKHQNASEHIAHTFKTVSIEKPLNHDFDDAFTLKDILEAPVERADDEIEHDIIADTHYTATSTGKINRKGSFYLDDDTRDT